MSNDLARFKKNGQTPAELPENPDNDAYDAAADDDDDLLKDIPQRRHDTLSYTRRVAMQQGFPVRDDATRSLPRQMNQPAQTGTVPDHLRQNKIPVRQNAAKGRTIPRMGRGQNPQVMPQTPRSDVHTGSGTNGTYFHGESADILERTQTFDAVGPSPDTPSRTGNVSPLLKNIEKTIMEEKTIEIPGQDSVSSSDRGETEEANVSAYSMPTMPLATRSPDKNRRIQNGMPSRAARPAETGEKTVLQENFAMQKTAAAGFPEGTVAASVQTMEKHTAEKPVEAVSAFPSPEELMPTVILENTPESTKDTVASSSPKKPQQKNSVIGVVAGLCLVIIVCLCIPAVLAKEPDTTPDYIMTEAYETEIISTQVPAGTDKQEDQTNENETAPPDIAPEKFSVTLDFYNRDDITVSTPATTLESLLNTIGYTVLDTDMFSLDMDVALTEDTVIQVDTITYGYDSETVSVPYTVQEIKVDTIPRGTKQYSQYGQAGVKTISYTTRLINDTEVDRWVSSENITKQPVNEIYYLGVGGSLVGNDGKTYTYSHYRVVNATYYDLEGLTYLGYEADESVVAVDKDYIPLGTKLYVKNDQFDFGVRIAADTGSMIQEWEVDIWLDDSNPYKEAFAYVGYWRDMRIYYLD